MARFLKFYLQKLCPQKFMPILRALPKVKSWCLPSVSISISRESVVICRCWWSQSNARRIRLVTCFPNR